MNNKQILGNETENARYALQKRIWLIVGIVVFGVIVAVYINSRTSIQKQYQQGWATFDAIKDITALAMDPQGRVWAAQVGYVITEPMSGEIIEWPDVPGTWASGSDRIEAMAFDNDGRLWIYTVNISLGVRDVNGEWTYREGGLFVEDILVDGKGRVWVRGLLGSMDMVAPETNNQTPTSSFRHPDCDHLSGSDVDQLGRIWTLCDNSLRMLDEDDEWIIMTVLPTNRSGPVSQWGKIVIDSNNQVWVGNDKYLQAIWPEENKKVYEVTRAGELILVADQEGRLWIERFNGWLLMTDGVSEEPVFYHPSNSGLIDGVISDILVDTSGQVWIATKNGISVYNPNFEPVPESIQETNTLTQNLLLASSLGVGMLIILGAVFIGPGRMTGVNLRKLGLGFVGWFVSFSLFWGLMRFLIYEIEGGYILVYILQPLSIVATLILLAINRSWASLGVITAVVVNAMLLILLYGFGIRALYYWTPFFLIPYS